MTTKTKTESAAGESGRAAAWRILAAPLTAAPDAETLSRCAKLGEFSREAAADDCARTLRGLAEAAAQTETEAAADDYQDLFIGLGRGKVVPYGSWHISGALMDRPLARLRGDLRALGFARTPQTREPEDHAGALCETMAMLAADDSALSFAAQKKFFDAHAAPWLGGFFAEVSAAAETPFYRALGEFGGAFLAFESRYFSMPF